MAAGYDYTILDRETGAVVARGSSAECAAALGMSKNVFQQQTAAEILEGLHPKWTGSRIWTGKGKQPARQPIPRAEQKKQKAAYQEQRRSARKKAKEIGRPKPAAQAPKTTDKHCRGCIWRETDGSCNWWAYHMGERGCPPGEGCDKRQTKGKRGPRLY